MMDERISSITTEIGHTIDRLFPRRPGEYRGGPLVAGLRTKVDTLGEDPTDMLSLADCMVSLLVLAQQNLEREPMAQSLFDALAAQLEFTAQAMAATRAEPDEHSVAMGVGS